ncbi:MULTISPECIES: ABC transporter permease [unclassified Allobranchiibius]|uniref:ABC transporter permease n=1 Tax=unclassified Allobranchiibius TaxID=2649857 RepID=UPI001AA14AC2|nr:MULTISPECIES: ABC transporter permease [unclassified Allobranchiibius]MBO1767182.1 DUF3533 domain-containing protein [Allobranchiibius sp. GilTou38]UIJ35813.1 DUF3533 domain-containing protein [Allobranchiibius sp. GilTou73]
MSTSEPGHGATRRPPTTGPRPGYERSADESFRGRLRDVLGPRSIGVILAVLLVQLLFIASYVGAFHKPQPHAITVDVVSSNGWQGYVANKLNAIDGRPVAAYASSDRAESTKELREGRRQAVYLFNPNSKQDTLLVNSAEGSSITAAVNAIFSQVASSQSRTLKTQDVVPVQAGDSRGLTSFYLVVGWMVGGYLLASFLGIRRGTRARNFRRMLWRLVGCAAYAVASGIGGALVVGPIIGALNGHFWAVAGVGMLVSLTASVFTMGMEALFGIIGIGISILLFVVLGNPSAGGAYGYELLPTLWRVVGRWLPNGAGVDSVRSIVYLGGDSLGLHLLVLVWWLLLGLLTFFLVSNNTYWGFRRDDPSPQDAAEGRSED